MPVRNKVKCAYQLVDEMSKRITVLACFVLIFFGREQSCYSNPCFIVNYPSYNPKLSNSCASNGSDRIFVPSILHIFSSTVLLPQALFLSALKYSMFIYLSMVNMYADLYCYFF